MVPQHALVRATVGGDALARGEDREHRGRHPGDLPEQPGRLRAPLDVVPRREAVPVEEERLPAVVVGDLVLVGRDVLEVRELVLVPQDLFELTSDRGSSGFHVGDPGEGVRVEERVVSDERVTPEVSVEPADEPLTDTVRRVDEPLTERSTWYFTGHECTIVVPGALG